MERLVQIASNSMRIHAENQRLIAAGLANQNTIAFKRDYGNASSAYFEGEGATDRVFPTRGENAVDLEVGKIIPTENPLDVSIEGPGFFAAQKSNGDDVLTRRGDFKIGADRILRNGEGVAILGDGGPITIPPYESIEISRDGSVLIRAPGTAADAAATPVGRLRMVNVPASNVEKGIDALLRTRDRSIPQADANITLNPKGLEASNISPIDAMVDMLGSSRSFELSVKLLTTAKELDDQTAKLMRTDR